MIVAALAAVVTGLQEPADELEPGARRRAAQPARPPRVQQPGGLEHFSLDANLARVSALRAALEAGCSLEQVASALGVPRERGRRRGVERAAGALHGHVGALTRASRRTCRAPAPAISSEGSRRAAPADVEESRVRLVADRDRGRERPGRPGGRRRVRRRVRHRHRLRRGASSAPAASARCARSVAERVAAGAAREFAGRAHRRADRPAAPDPVHRPELQRPRRRDRAGRPRRADPLHQVTQHASWARRRRPIPRGSTKLDWEVELGIVIGRRCRTSPTRTEAAATPSPATCSSTTSASAPSRWSAAASGPRASPPRPSTRAGPWLVDARRDRRRAGAADVARRQRRPAPGGSTATMLFGPAFVVHYLSQFMVLEPGDLIDTGTPPGVGMGRRPPVWLAGRRCHGARHRGSRQAAPARGPRHLMSQA